MARPLAMLDDVPAPASPPRLALGAKGFRPFFALAALHAVVLVPLWVAIVSGVNAPSAYLDPAMWHAHEMIFGFTVAVIAGFLLTAVGNWTKRETLVGAPLLALAAVWIIGRVAILFAASLPRGVPAVADTLFLPLLIAALARPLLATNNRRNFVMLGVLAVLAMANAVVHLDALGVVAAGSARRATFVALDVVLAIVLLIAGRVFPMFTRNATGVETIRSHPRLDVATVAGMMVVALLDAVATDARLPNLLAGVVGLLAAARAAHWGARHSTREPLLWILHAGYAWLVLGLVLRAATAVFPTLSTSAATHALTVGAIGSLTLGMMARVSLGHTGRALVTPAAMRGAFAAVLVAAFVRVVMPILTPSAYRASLVTAAAAWALAFFTFLVVYLPILTTARRDGKPG